MEYRSLGRSGLKVTKLCLGAMTFGESRGFMKGVTSSDDEGRRVLDRALEAGIDFIDTANVYAEGRSEELLGEWLEGRRHRVVLATKCRMPTDPTAAFISPNDKGLSRKNIVAACEASLRRLRTDYIDLYQAHLQDRAVPIDETLRAFDDLVRSGKVRYVGCSNYTGNRMVEALWSADRNGTARFESMQIQWSLVERGAEREMVPVARQHGMGVLVWSPLARGFLSGKYKRGEAAPPGSRLASWQDSYRSLDADRQWGVLDAVGAIAEARGTTSSAVSLAWLLAQPETSSVILGARTVAQLEDNLKSADLVLSVDELKKLEETSRPEWGYPYNFISSMDRTW